MKDWSYYEDPKVTYYGYDYRKEYTDALVQSINDTPMTAADREIAMSKVNQQVREHMLEINKPYRDLKKARIEEFWADAQAELSYDQYLDEGGVSLLRATAYERGHASGFGSIFAELEELSFFAHQIIQSAARKSQIN